MIDDQDVKHSVAEDRYIAIGKVGDDPHIIKCINKRKRTIYKNEINSCDL